MLSSLFQSYSFYSRNTQQQQSSRQTFSLLFHSWDMDNLSIFLCMYFSSSQHFTISVIPAVPCVSSPVGKSWDVKSAIHSKTCMRIATSRISASLFFSSHFQQAFCHLLGFSTSKLISQSVVIAFFYSTLLHTNKLLHFFFLPRYFC